MRYVTITNSNPLGFENTIYTLISDGYNLASSGRDAGVWWAILSK